MDGDIENFNHLETIKISKSCLFTVPGVWIPAIAAYVDTYGW